MSVKDLLLPYVSMAPLGALAAFAYQTNPLSLLYFPPLVLVIYEGFKLFVSLQRETDDALVALADSIDRRDKYTYQHSMRVAELVEATAGTLGLTPRESGPGRRRRPRARPGQDRDRQPRAAQADGTDSGRAHASSRSTPSTATSWPAGSACSARVAASSATITSAGTARATRRTRRRADPPGRPPHHRGRLLRRHDVGPAVSQAPVPGRSREGTAALRRHAVRPHDRAGVRRGTRRRLGDGGRRRRQQLQSWPPEDIVAELSRGRDPAQLWAAASFTLCRLLDVPDCDLYRMDDDGGLVCVASICEGEWHPEDLGKRADPALRSMRREAMTARRSLPHLLAERPAARRSGDRAQLHALERDGQGDRAPGSQGRGDRARGDRRDP